jgi:pre-rRNA-processing protein TSR2
MATSAPAPGGGVQLPPTPEKLQQTLDLSIWYTLSLWPALHVAVADSWGGPDSADKRDWFAGAISDLLTSRPETDHDDLVEFLLQVMQDEFECNVEDDSEEKVAGELLDVRRRVLVEGDVSVLGELEVRWRNRGQIKTNIQIVENDQSVGDDEDWEEEDGDVRMADAQDIVPDLVPVLQKKERPGPEVDEDGFTKVVGKKKR